MSTKINGYYTIKVIAQNELLIHSTYKNKPYSISSFVRYADHVFVGDEVLTERNDKVMPAKVIGVSSSFLQGNEKY